MYFPYHLLCIKLDENKPQHNQRIFPGIFILLILYVDHPPVHIVCKPKIGLYL